MLEIAKINYRQRPSSHAQWWFLSDNCGSTVSKLRPSTFGSHMSLPPDGIFEGMVLVGGVVSTITQTFIFISRFNFLSRGYFPGSMEDIR